ncbi:Uncharacterised protein [Salmonella enterica]|nr:Uncharacterised protein [Salmonella enterica]
MADMRQVVFRQAGHFHYGTAVNTILEHGSGNFQFVFVAPAWLDAFLCELLCDGHECADISQIIGHRKTPEAGAVYGYDRV